MAKRKSLSKKIRFEVFKRDSFTCQYCGRAAPEVILHADHIQPVSKDGEDDILNLITSCVDCNAGKSDRLLSDDSVVLRQKSQLDELQERREQIEMMLDWRQGLRGIDEIGIRAAADEWESITNGYYLTEPGLLALKKLIKKFGLQSVMDAMQKSIRYLQTDGNGQMTQESVDYAWSKVGGICQLASLPEWKQRLYHIRNIARSRSGEDWWPQTSAEILALFEEAHNEGDSLDQLEELAWRGIGYRELPGVLRDWICQSQKDRRARERSVKKPTEDESFYAPAGYPSDAISASVIDELQETGQLDYPN
jgi:hypothetical protein